VYSRDEPHDLALIHSLMLDFDLDLANNYDSVHHGSKQAGERFAHGLVDHHVCWYIDGTRFVWSELFEG
jgi:hypothetical protein